MDHLKHISLNSHHEVAALCQPLKGILDFNFFEYFRLFPDGSRLSLSTTPELIENSYFTSETFEKVYCADYYPMGESIAVMKQDILLKETKERLRYEAHFKTTLERFNVDNIVFFLIKGENFTDGFGYGGFGHDETFTPALLSNLDLLRRFHLYFGSEAKDLVSQAHQQKVVQPWRDPQIKIPDNISRKSFLNNTNLKKLYLPQIDCYLSRAELKVLKYFSNGVMSSKQIGQQCFLSSRTVESHLANIKAKIGCQYNHELILKIRELKLNDYFVSP